VVVLLVGLAAALRFPTLDVQPYWFDERLTQGILALSFPEMVETLITTGRETNPPLYYVLAWPWARVFGDGPVALRSLSALFGTAMVAVAYLAGRELVSVRVGRVTAALAAVSPLLVWYSQEARAYALLALLSSLSLLYFARSLRDPRSLRWWALASCLALLTHYFALFLVAIEGAWLLLRHRRRAWPALAAAGLTTALLVPLGLSQRAEGGTSWISTVPLGSRLRGSVNGFLAGPSEGVEVFGAALLVLALVGLGLGLWRAADEERRGARLALLVGALTLAVTLACALVGMDLINGRNLIIVWLPIAVAVATGFGSRRTGTAGRVAGALFCAVSIGVVIAVSVSTELQREPSPRPASAGVR
jgi:mannosyltransferase